MQKIEMLAFRKAEAVALKVIPLNVSIIARFNPDLPKSFIDERHKQLDEREQQLQVEQARLDRWFSPPHLNPPNLLDKT